MIKTVPAESSDEMKDIYYEDLDLEDIFKNRKTDSHLKSVLDSIYNEHPDFWPCGLDINLFNGYGDKFLVLKHNKDIIGFIGLQMYRDMDTDDGFGNYISIGLLPEFRGKGIAKKFLLKFLKGINDDNLIWTCNKNNKASKNLLNSLNKVLDNKINLIIT